MEGGKRDEMAELLEYFEAQSRSLDQEGGASLQDTTLRDFISLIKFNGVPILPPVLTLSRREEMVTYKRDALRKESTNKERRRERLQARVQSIVAGVEERRAAKLAIRLKSSPSDKGRSPSGKSGNKSRATETVPHLNTSFTVSPGPASNIPVEINITVPSPDITSTNSSLSMLSDSVKISPKSSTASTKSKPNNTSTSSVGRSRSKVPKYKTMGKLNKTKSYSSQHIESSSTLYANVSSNDSDTSRKNSLSPHSKDMFPHPPEGRPARRRSPSSSLRQSVSTPDLRTVDFSVEAAELKKPLPAHKYSPDSGRPQANEQSTESKARTVENKIKHNEEKFVPKSRTIDKRKQDTTTGQINYVLSDNSSAKPSGKVSRTDSSKLTARTSDKVVQKPTDKHTLSDKRDSKDHDKHTKKKLDYATRSDQDNDSKKESNTVRKGSDKSGKKETDRPERKESETRTRTDSHKIVNQVQEKTKNKENVKFPEKEADKNTQQWSNPQGIETSKAVNLQDEDTSPITLCNPLEQLEREIEQVEKAERAMTLQKNNPDSVYTALDPIQTAAAELFPFPLSEEQALATLDSLQSEFTSLEQGDSLPQDYNGIPLTSMKQQQIIHMLSKLSKALNIEDTLTSTTGSSSSGDVGNDVKQESNKGQHSQFSNDVKGDIFQSVPIGAIGGSNTIADNTGRSANVDQSGMSYSNAECEESLETLEDMSSNVTSDSNTTGQSSTSVLSSAGTSASSNQSRGRMSPTALSILSSASSISGSRSRISPKSLKNTVHFSSFITEISTSASQSIEDKISVRKLDITPANSQSFEENSNSVTNSSRNLAGSGARVGPTSQQPHSLLSNVSLSPSVDSSQGSPGECIQKGFPFDSAHHENELNTSDKENEFVPHHDDSSDSNDFENHMRSNGGKGQQVLNVFTANIPAGPIGNNHPLLLKASVKSDNSESSTLKGSQEPFSSQENVSRYNKSMDTQYYYGTASTDLGKYMTGTNTDGDASTMQEQITKYILSHSGVNEQDVYSTDDNVETKKPNKNTSILDESAIILQPVIYSRESKADDTEVQEERKFSKLENVQLEDSDSDSDESVSVEEVTEELVDQPIKSVLVKEEESCEEEAEQEISEPIKSGEVEEEEEGKAEHIQRYLSQVHEQSLQNEQDFKMSEEVDNPEGNYGHVLDNIGTSINSFMSSIQHMNHLSQEDMFRLQAEQFELLQQQLIEQQQSQLEELFVLQRREQMKLETEIEQYHETIKSQDDVETVMLQESLNSQVVAAHPPAALAWQDQYQFQAPLPVAQSVGVVYQQPAPPQVPAPEGDISVISHQDSTYSTLPYQDPRATLYGKLAPRPSQGPISSKSDPNQSRSSNPYSYVSSPGQYAHRKDKDNVSDVSSFARASPKQLIFSNQSTPKVYKPVIRSPVKQPAYTRPTGHVAIPEQVFDPRMKPRFDKVSAAVKGYLTRKLLKTPKVQEILKTISDTRNFAFSFQSETPIKNGSYTRGDMNLLERIVAQLQAALLDIHEIFFNIPVSERMGLIAHARQLEQDKHVRESQRSSTDSSRLHPRVSSATLKAIDRKRRAQLAEEAVFGSTEFRPKSAPPNTSSPHPATDISGPLRRQFHYLFSRALKPLQGQISPIRPDSQLSVRRKQEVLSQTNGRSLKFSDVGMTCSTDHHHGVSVYVADQMAVTASEPGSHNFSDVGMTCPHVTSECTDEQILKMSENDLTKNMLEMSQINMTNTSCENLFINAVAPNHQADDICIENDKSNKFICQTSSTELPSKIQSEYVRASQFQSFHDQHGSADVMYTAIPISEPAEISLCSVTSEPVNAVNLSFGSFHQNDNMFDNEKNNHPTKIQQSDSDLCKMCGKYFSRKHTMDCHVCAPAGVSFTCDKCKKMYKSKAYLTKHKCCYCNVCSDIFSSFYKKKNPQM